MWGWGGSWTSGRGEQAGKGHERGSERGFQAERPESLFLMPSYSVHLNWVVGRQSVCAPSSCSWSSLLVSICPIVPLPAFPGPLQAPWVLLASATQDGTLVPAPLVGHSMGVYLKSTDTPACLAPRITSLIWVELATSPWAWLPEQGASALGQVGPLTWHLPLLNPPSYSSPLDVEV